MRCHEKKSEEKIRPDQVFRDGKVISYSEHIVKCIIECLRYYPGGKDAAS